MPVFNKYTSCTTPFVQRIDNEPHMIHLTTEYFLAFQTKGFGVFCLFVIHSHSLFRRSFFSSFVVFSGALKFLCQFIYYNSLLSQRLYFLRISSLRRCLSSFFFSFSSCLFLAASSLSIFRISSSLGRGEFVEILPKQVHLVTANKFPGSFPIYSS